MLMDVSALDRHRLFQCESQQRSHAQVARAFCDHGLVWRPGRVRTEMSQLAFEQLDLYALHYGAEVEVRPRSFQNFLLVHVSLSGVMDIDADGGSLVGRPGDVMLFGLQRSLRMRWSEGARQLIVKVPHDRLPPGLAVPPLLAFEPVQARQLRGLLQALLLAAQSRREVPGQAAWVTQLEQSLVSFIVQAMCPAAAAPARESAPAHPASQAGDQRRIDRLMGYLQSHLGAPVALEDMARATGLSPRGLHLLCQRRLDTTPTVLLRDLRLDAVRARLMASPETPVTEVAVAHGFYHLGRFAGYYRDRFAELPTQTRRGAGVPERLAA